VFLAYVEAEQTEQQIAPENRVELEVLAEGAAVEGETSNPAIPIVITGFAVFLAFVALAFVFAAIGSRRSKRAASRRRAQDASPDGSEPEEPEPAEPDAATGPSSDAADDHVLIGAGTRTD
jgi:flagellar biosynthesis/type III secretory pathway M-ring protein FliF/YscJ